MERFFNYPICLMQIIKNDKDKEGLISIIAFSVMNFSEKMKYDNSDIARQIMYLYYRKPNSLDSAIRSHIDDMIDEERMYSDETYNGFNGEVFNPEEEIKALLSEFNINTDFYNLCVYAYREHQAISLLNLNPALKPDFEKHYKKSKKFIHDFEMHNGPDAWTSVSTEIIFDVFKEALPMDYLRIVSAVKSILGKRNYNLTYKSVLLCRMFGCKKASILENLFIEKSELRTKHEYLSRRRQWEKLINTAESKGLLSYYSTGRQFFVSNTMNKDELKNSILSRKENYDKISITA